MKKMPQMIDMARTPEEKKEAETPQQPNYPWGLSISLCDEELQKVGIAYEDINVDDIVQLHCLATVTSKSSNAVQGTEPTCRIELQITAIATDEDEEEAPKESPAKKLASKLYNR